MPRGGTAFLITLVSGAALCALLALLPNRHPQPAATYNPTRICDSAFEKRTDYLASTENHITVALDEGCFGPLIRLPAAWHGTFIHPKGRQENWWLAYWVISDPRPNGPFGPNEIAGVNARGLYFRVQGHGEVVFYSNDVVPGKQEDATGSTEFHAETKQLSDVNRRNTDSHICDKPADAYYAHLGLLFFYQQGQGDPPEFLFDDLHADNKINWAQGFKGTVPVCFVVDGKGNVSNIIFPQAPPEHIKKHMVEEISAWHFKGGFVRNSRDERTPVSCQLAYDFTF
jgi:hypothetical protein